jgi:hypothetical protein
VTYSWLTAQTCIIYHDVLLWAARDRPCTAPCRCSTALPKKRIQAGGLVRPAGCGTPLTADLEWRTFILEVLASRPGDRAQDIKVNGNATDAWAPTGLLLISGPTTDYSYSGSPGRGADHSALLLAFSATSSLRPAGSLKTERACTTSRVVVRPAHKDWVGLVVPMCTVQATCPRAPAAAGAAANWLKLGLCRSIGRAASSRHGETRPQTCSSTAAAGPLSGIYRGQCSSQAERLGCCWPTALLAVDVVEVPHPDLSIAARSTMPPPTRKAGAQISAQATAEFYHCMTIVVAGALGVTRPNGEA